MTKITKNEQLIRMDYWKYLFFADGVLHAGIGSHRSVLEESGRTNEDILIAGAFFTDPYEIRIDAHGSEGLNIGEEDVDPIVNLLNSLPDSRTTVIKGLPRITKR